MSGRYVLSPRAQADLDESWDHPAQLSGADQAEFHTRQLWRYIEAVTSTPSIGRPCPEVRAGYYSYPSGSHFLFYLLMDGAIDVVRILHERMDFGRHL